jgi:probable phosphoglycerate mutase
VSRRLLIEADGGSRGNPGRAGYGALVRDADTGRVLAERAGGLGTATNNVAEYRGLIAGLEAAGEIAAAGDVEAVEVRMDSKLVVEQMAGRWQVKHPSMRPLARHAAGLAAALPAVVWTWVPRARNGAADALANQAMDGRDVHADPWRSSPISTVSPAPTGWLADAGPPLPVLLLRHGATDLTAERRFCGRTDAALSALGVAQAAAAAAALAGRGDVARVISSPLQRALRTAEAVAGACGVDLDVEPDLAETDFGDWEGLTLAEITQGWPELARRWLSDPALAAPGGESLADAERRAWAARDRVLASRAGQSGAVVVVSHVTPIKGWTRAAILAEPGALFRLHLDAASITEIHHHADGRGVLRGFNHTAHLAAL